MPVESERGEAEPRHSGRFGKIVVTVVLVGLIVGAAFISIVDRLLGSGGPKPTPQGRATSAVTPPNAEREKLFAGANTMLAIQGSGGEIPLILVREMERAAAFDGWSEVSATVQLDPSAVERANAAVRELAPAIEAAVTTERWKTLSTHAIAETAADPPPPGWAAGLSLAPLHQAPGGQGTVLGLQPESSPVRLPSHAPIVQRRVVLAALYDPARDAISAVWVSIRGWAEE
jgi:hypothetical protein